MLIIEMFDDFAQVYSDNQRNIEKLFRLIENQHKSPIFNICRIEDNKIEWQENRNVEILNFLNHFKFQELREWLYFSDNIIH